MTHPATYPGAHWSPETDFSSSPFFIRRMDTSGYVKPAEVPEAMLPLIGFIYVASGEVLVEVDGTPFLCQPGQILLIPRQVPFAIRYYRNAVGYTGGFAPSILSDTKPLRYLSAPHHQGFWFDEGAFMGELFNMLEDSFEKGDRVFVEKGLDLLLSRIKPSQGSAFPAAVSRFLELVFNPDRLPGTIAYYARETGISENYLSRLVKKSTGRSVGSWIDIVRIQRAKRMLSETRLPIIDIASRTGIEDQSYFARLFKKETGLTPSAFRKKMQG
ncbi:MAG: AraC family transcriptional regulator [Bacteroidales bacterium]|nr:AraC family transcriptional regulator [Bacteroidales bacterium]